ncbi:hypothetical protein PGT21_028421 [Puccinia graminis f. sp. tritici]|uniref:Uncharacterized protein n=1 Tax=Puccinia graminis f. sp. tritici TaxID=56615 RepID=A0A5B0P1F1_PUCGR|nr:hypothetical protein PGT21_028421 [Puccinia graminis f. sp. tritici]KAA1121603.1 hypothetical protein PGTUg99_033371 [Puccinia graminis f. sp. tritici]
MNLRFALLALGLFRCGAALSERGAQSQSVVSWDRHSILLRGERIFIQSGEFILRIITLPV